MATKTAKQREIDQAGAFGGAGGQPPITSASNLGAPLPAVPAPTDLTIVSNQIAQSAVSPMAIVTLSWRPPSGFPVTGYTVQSATDASFTADVTTESVVDSSQNPSNSLSLPPGQTRYFRVAAILGQVQGTYSASVTTTTATDTTPPAVPTSLAATFNTAGDLEISWINPSSANFRDVEVSIYADSGFTTLLFQTFSATQRVNWTASQNRQAGSGTPDPAVFVRMRSRSWAAVFSSTAVPTTQPVKAVPANVSGLTQSWSGDTGAAAADLVVTWSAAAGAAFYRLTIDGVSRDVTGTRYVYPLDQNRVEHSGTPDPALSLSLIGVDGLDQVSASAATATATNAAPATPTGVSLQAFFSTVAVLVGSALPADGTTYRFRLIQTSPSASDITWDAITQAQTRAISVAATYQVGVRAVDVFGQTSSETLSSTAVSDALTLADLRGAGRYSDQLTTSPATLKSTLADNALSGTGGTTSVPTFVGATSLATADSATSVQQTPHASTVLNDLMIAQVVARGDSQTLNTPAGWTAVPNTSAIDTGPAPDIRIGYFYKVAGASETSPYTFSGTVSSTFGVVISTYRGVDTSAPINDSDNQLTTSNNATATAPSITTTVNNCLLVMGITSTTATETLTPDSGAMTERWEANAGSVNVKVWGATESFATAGATGTRTATFTVAKISECVLIALAPTPVGGGGGAISYPSNASWVRWIRFERDILERYRTITLAMNPISGTSNWYIRTSQDGSTWSYFAGPVTSSRILTAVADAAAAQAAAVSAATLGKSTASRVDLPSVVEARYVEVWLRNTGAVTDVAEFYPRRVVQSDDMEAESVKAINILAGTITGDRIAAATITGTNIAAATITASNINVTSLSAISANLGTVTAGTVTGATIQTASSGQRVVINNSNITIYVPQSFPGATPTTPDTYRVNFVGVTSGVFVGGLEGVHDTVTIPSKAYMILRARAPASQDSELILTATTTSGSNNPKVSISAFDGTTNRALTLDVNNGNSIIGPTTVVGTLAANSGFLTPRSSGSATFGLDTTGTGSSITVANGATATLFGAADNFSGIIIINSTTVSGACAIFLSGGGGIVLLGSSLPNVFTVASGTASRVNVYQNGSFHHILQNNFGFSMTFNVLAIRTRTGQ